MNATTDAILDAAESRIREVGYNGFSFRDIATDVGVKSASVHYHFPTKEALAAAVARRYTERFMDDVDKRQAEGLGVASAWLRSFQRSLHEDRKMCLCGTLGATFQNLPSEVVREVQNFFQLSLQKLMQSGLDRKKAAQLLASLEGGMLLAHSLEDPSLFDDATEPLSLQ